MNYLFIDGVSVLTLFFELICVKLVSVFRCRHEDLVKQFSDERDILESQIEILQ